jgi:DNA/RNA-binding protein KIN17
LNRHTTSESHVRQILLVGEDPKKYINDYSNQFQRDFLQLLRTSHGEKKVHLNHFYQEYIGNKEHVHMNSTKWPSLTEFAKFLGREGICRVEENDKGLHVAWIDNSPEALRRQDAIRKKDRQDKGDEEREQALIREQVRRAQIDADARGDADLDEVEGKLNRAEGEKIKLSFGAKPLASKADSPPVTTRELKQIDSSSTSRISFSAPTDDQESLDKSSAAVQGSVSIEKVLSETTPADKVSLKIGVQGKPKNVFATAKKNALGSKKSSIIEQPKKISEAERIMREELQRKRNRDTSVSGGPTKKQKN